jgi:hypothetical protein
VSDSESMAYLFILICAAIDMFNCGLWQKATVD